MFSKLFLHILQTIHNFFFQYNLLASKTFFLSVIIYVSSESVEFYLDKRFAIIFYIACFLKILLHHSVFLLISYQHPYFS